MNVTEKVNIRGLDFLTIAKDDVPNLIKNLLIKDGCTIVYTPNAEIAYDATKDTQLRNLLNRADILLPDGEGVILASKILKTPIKEKIAGVEFGEAVARICSETGQSLYILGGKAGIADKAAENLKAKYTGLKIAGTHDGYFDKTGEENEKVIAEINLSNPDVLFVCFGAPAQEKWTDVNKIYFKNAKIIACLGGSADVYAGTEKRAPKLMISLKSEWLYRLLKHPDRIGRMTKLPKYIAGTMAEKFRCGGCK